MNEEDIKEIDLEKLPPDEKNYEYEGEFINPSKNKTNKALSLWQVILVSVIVSCTVFFVSDAIKSKFSNRFDVGRLKEQTTVDVEHEKSKEISNKIPALYKKVIPSIVAISTMEVDSVRDFFGSVYQQVKESSGTGIILLDNETEILVLTNNHVVEGAKEVSVIFFDEKSAKAEVLGSDSSADIAIVSIKKKNVSKETLSKIKIAKLGNSDKLLVGENVIAIGNALGYGQSLSVGYISGLNREAVMEDSGLKLIQTDAAINPGNSGGPLLNMNGEVIGINTVKFAEQSVEGMGFAIPISQAEPIIEMIINAKTIPDSQRAFLGITGVDIDKSLSNRFNIPKGVYVRDVVGDAAKKGGIQKGDIIYELNNRSIKTLETLKNVLYTLKNGDTVVVKVKRQVGNEYKDLSLKVKLGKYPNK